MKTVTELIEQAEKYCNEQCGSGEIVAQQAYISGYQQALKDIQVSIECHKAYDEVRYEAHSILMDDYDCGIKHFRDE